MGKKAGKKKADVVEEIEEVEEVEELEEVEAVEEPEAEPEDVGEAVEEVEEIEEGEEIELSDDDIIDAAADVTDVLGLEPPLWKEGMDAQTTAKRMRKAWKFIQADDVLKDETLKTLIAMGWEPPKPKKAAAGKPAKVAKPAKEKKEKAPKAPKAGKDWNNPVGNTALLVHLAVTKPGLGMKEIQAHFEKEGLPVPPKGTIMTQYGVASSAIACAKALGLLK